MAKASTEILPTQNEAWGFFGTMRERAPAAWPLAMAAVMEATGCADHEVQAFLDSRYGRHFADDVLDVVLVPGRSLQAAVGAAVVRWMGWAVSPRTARETGIPVGMPHLTGFVVHASILAEAEG